MIKKILLIVLFLLLFLSLFIVLDNNIVKSFSVDYNDLTYDFGNIDNSLYEYNIVTYSSFSGGTLNLLSFSNIDDVYYSDGALHGCIGRCAYYSLIMSSGSVTKYFDTSFNGTGLSSTFNSVVYSNFDFLDVNGDVFFAANNISLLEPYIVNFQDILGGNFTKVVVNAGDYNSTSEINLYLNSNYYPDDYILADPFSGSRILLNSSSKYCIGVDFNGHYMYEVPISVLDIDLVEGNRYSLSLSYYNASPDYFIETFDDLEFTVGAIALVEKEQADRDKQTSLLEEQTEISKGIFETIGSILNFINPLSEDFFVYKLIDLLLEALKSLFLPSEDFFNDAISDLNDWLSDRLGIVYYPIDIVVDFLTRIADISETNTAVISWNNIDFMGATLIPAGSFDFYSVLSTDIMVNIHSIYLTFVDVILYLSLIVLCYNTFVDLFGGKYMDDLVSDSSEAYRNYGISQKAKAREARGVGFTARK